MTHEVRPDVTEFVSRPLQSMLIDGEMTAGATDATMSAASPSDGATLGAVPLAGSEDVDAAVGAARAALGPWRRMAPAARERMLRRVADLVEGEGNSLAEIESLDNGKPVAKTRPIDAPVAARLAYAFAGWPTKIAGETPQVSAPDLFVYTLRQPIGVVATIIPWNYPLVHTVQKIMPALACGNTVVFKPSEKSSLPSLRLAELFAEADLPPGVVNVITGDGPTTGVALTNHAGVDKVAFTGSVAAGRAVMRAAAGSVKRVGLELGNKGANIVFADADMSVAIPRSFGAAFGNTGQSCVAGSRLFVQEDVYSEVVDGLVDLAGKAQIGHALDPATTLGPIVDEKQLNAVMRYIEQGRADGATVRHGGSRLTDGDLARGFYVEPTIFTDVEDAMTIACEEIFGPVLTVHPFNTEEEAVARANDTPYGLAAAVWTGSLSRAHRVAAALETGVVWVNTFDMFDSAVPFGGLKQSGFGRDNGPNVIDMYTESRRDLGEHQMRFQLPTRIVWHSPAAEAVVEELAAIGATRVLLVSDAGIAGAGLLAPFQGTLEAAEFEVTLFTDVAGNPTTDDVAGATAAADTVEVEAIVALGGGSVIDVAKAAAMLLANGGRYADYQWEGTPITNRSLPMVAVPTTAGTGSEVTKVAVISDPARPFKKGVLSPLMYPHTAILDPQLTMGLPARLTAATGMDALSHALEAYIGRRPSPLSDLLATESLRLIAEYLPRATRDGNDAEARREMMQAALFGGIAMDQAGLGLIHALSGGVCSHLHLHHGEANAMLLPFVMEFNAQAVAAERMDRLARTFGVAPGGDLAATFAEFVRSLDLHVGLHHLGSKLAGADWDAIAAESMQMAMIPNNACEVTEADCRDILEAMQQ